MYKRSKWNRDRNLAVKTIQRIISDIPEQFTTTQEKSGVNQGKTTEEEPHQAPDQDGAHPHKTRDHLPSQTKGSRQLCFYEALWYLDSLG